MLRLAPVAKEVGFYRTQIGERVDRIIADELLYTEEQVTKA